MCFGHWFCDVWQFCFKNESLMIEMGLGLLSLYVYINIYIHLCLALVVKEFKISVEQGRAVTTINILLKWELYTI